MHNNYGHVPNNTKGCSLYGTPKSIVYQQCLRVEVVRVRMCVKTFNIQCTTCINLEFSSPPPRASPNVIPNPPLPPEAIHLSSRVLSLLQLDMFGMQLKRLCNCFTCLTCAHPHHPTVPTTAATHAVDTLPPPVAASVVTAAVATFPLTVPAIFDERSTRLLSVDKP